ncbi:MAG: TerB family tellurite resistance protein [Halioglobus sp.]
MLIKTLKALFDTPDEANQQSSEQRMQRAAAALLIETARADFTQDGKEEAALAQLLIDNLSLEPADVQQLIEQAGGQVDEATSLYEFTREINDHYGADEKRQLIEMMWKVAYADGRLDKYEEHLIRQVAELTYVSHQDYIRCKLGAKP